MHKIYKTYSIVLLAVLSLVLSCEDSNNVIDQVVEGTERGAILRGYNIDGQEIFADQTDSEFTLTLEAQDIENGDLLSSIEVYSRFIDNTTAAGDLSTGESLVETVNASEFYTGDFGYPRLDYSVSLGELIAANGLQASQIKGQDQFRVRFELVLTDGRRYSFDQNTGTLTGSFFRSPFLYSINLVCPPFPPTPGVWTVDMQDSYGDGWNGASLEVTIDGETESFSIEDGASGTDTFTVPADAEVIEIKYVSGDWDSEVTFQVTSANGNTILDLGPSPTAGLQLIDYCLENL